MPPEWGTAERYTHCGHWLPSGEEELCPLDGEQLKNSHCGHWPPPAGEELCPLDGEQLKNTVIVVIGCCQEE